MKIVLCGPPHVGKSCFRYGLKEAIKSIEGAPYPYFITACPDGEGSWFQEAVNNHPEKANKHKQAYKDKFTPAFVKRLSEEVKHCSAPLTLIDVGGIIDQSNEQICNTATHAVILSKCKNDLLPWQTFCRKLNLKIIAEIVSDYDACKDTPLTRRADGVYRGKVHHLERGDLTISNRPTVAKLAKIIHKMCVK